MHEKIKNYLSELEKEKNIKILLACETGSRAWGFPSQDSNFDVRIIYQHDKDWYLTLNERKDSIKHMYDNHEIDITGWDLRKCLHILIKSSPTLLEHTQSHLIYQADVDFMNDFNLLANTAYSPITTVFHHFSMAKNILEDVRDKHEYKLKSFFYVLRSSIACLWITQNKKMPPIDFRKMLSGVKIKEPLNKRIYELIDLKSTKNEDYIHSGEKELIEFFQQQIAYISKNFKLFTHSKANIEECNRFFIKQLNR